MSHLTPSNILSSQQLSVDGIIGHVFNTFSAVHYCKPAQSGCIARRNHQTQFYHVYFCEPSVLIASFKTMNLYCVLHFRYETSYQQHHTSWQNLKPSDIRSTQAHSTVD